MRKQFAVTNDDIQATAQLAGLEISAEQAREYVRSTIWKGKYVDEFFAYLKNKASEVAYSEEGFVFVIKRQGSSIPTVLLEVPEYGSATWVFVGAPYDIISNIRGVKQANVEDDGSDAWRYTLIRNPDKFLWFSGRIVHLTDEQWR